ncbi:TPA: hypothetical protein DDW69_02045 [candidate division CPR2 bacterium]|uniref:Uncharacterized protein n=1 Tax=candidate division CPR2 bacterium GW2011_GWC1_41_48 TaxID=1618344 RepID=A0A0G0YJU4_UNCC2|nr:MAG: hypothetical protein UT47_C0001G0211 [candidate division CPR2 bacterium GW2011_GWC2_39_35]KKR28094.1 MAG: hypothetical protein UT59_C0035G0004 [candidate division CPR2 bacterium GW2011_GWD1_39_7]KKR28136.1 MAG: hypothetical protein UT60_C0027G0026 [candidate division CPR2 bacterium GW2011_GWD2_39_7]KKS09806.1 MAG: hypothetical protein UU65_C0001G0211 [candidate division CPR2 bacterium GW2011_GWC1_41_48]OGB60292.1 MAG: hypothetical protein A2Y27_01480 [candidate division CPR2 bacterium G
MDYELGSLLEEVTCLKIEEREAGREEKEKQVYIPELLAKFKGLLLESLETSGSTYFPDTSGPGFRIGVYDDGCCRGVDIEISEGLICYNTNPIDMFSYDTYRAADTSMLMTFLREVPASPEEVCFYGVKRIWIDRISDGASIPITDKKQLHTVHQAMKKCLRLSKVVEEDLSNCPIVAMVDCYLSECKDSTRGTHFSYTIYRNGFLVLAFYENDLFKRCVVAQTINPKIMHDLLDQLLSKNQQKLQGESGFTVGKQGSGFVIGDILRKWSW